MKRFINPVPQFLKSNGDLCSAGKLYFLQEGTDILTSTKAIYLDAEGASQSINPVPLSNEGRMSNVFGEGKYRAKLYDSANVLQWTRDIDFDADELLASPEFRTAVLSLQEPAKKRAVTMRKLENTEAYKKYMQKQSKARLASISSVGLIPFLAGEEETQ